MLSIEPARLPAGVAKMPPDKRRKLLKLLQRRREIQSQRLFYALYPDEDTPWRGPQIQKGLIWPGKIMYSRDKYPKHMEFFAAGAEYRERCAMCANRIGKTMGMGGYEMACHLTGLYPSWWPGRRFKHPVSAWAVGKGFETTRDIMQLTLLGEVKKRAGHKTVDGRGVIPGHLLGTPTWKSGVADLVDTIHVRHVTGGWSDLAFKSYEQGRDSFEGTGKHVIWDDEEPPLNVYGEQLIRTATVDGIMMITFTPLEGLSEVVLQFIPAEQRPDLAT